ncbi:hypothetical protein BJ917_4633 [Pseudomonas sp. WPR_5_2]|nr:hypothetical protein BJ917_4633 [Pseudomonas sp. WPR_5_2]
MDGEKGECLRADHDGVVWPARIANAWRFSLLHERKVRGLPVCLVKLRGSVEHLPTLKKPTDDMTKAGLPVNMLAVYRSAYPRRHLCLSSSIG